MVKIYSFEAGKTLGSHEKFLKKLTSKGAEQVKTSDDGEVIIVFCPIVSRFEIDVNAAIDAALSEIQGLKKEEVILVAMHHTFDPDYTLPDNRKMESTFKLLVHCLFYRDKGLFRCPCNKAAYKKVRKELGLKSKLPSFEMPGMKGIRIPTLKAQKQI